jgi:GT2 family glycosyltransferase
MCDCSVIIVSFNTRGPTLDCIRSVRESSRQLATEIIVVDNDSGDGSADAIAAAHPDVVLVRNRENIGFARAVNDGLGRARGRIVLLLNPDTLVAPDAIAKLVDVLDASPQLGAVGPLVVSPDGTPDPHCAARRLTVARRLAWHFRLPTHGPSLHLGSACGPHGARKTERLSGAALAVRRELVDRIGPLDERFFLYFEDADWIVRIQQDGYNVACVTEASVVHAQGSSSRADPVARSKHALSSELAYFAKHEGASAALVLRAGIAVNSLLRALTVDAVRALRRQERYRLVADLQTLRTCVTR